MANGALVKDRFWPKGSFDSRRSPKPAERNGGCRDTSIISTMETNKCADGADNLKRHSQVIRVVPIQFPIAFATLRYRYCSTVVQDCSVNATNIPMGQQY
jgi:hypothetical protein